MRKTYIGYHLGANETITDWVTLEYGKNTNKTLFDDMTMPDSNEPGKAMPTIFAYDESGKVMFSSIVRIAPDLVKKLIVDIIKCPSDLLAKSDKNEFEKIQMISSMTEWPSATICPECNTEEMLELKQNIIDFTNAIFTNKSYQNQIAEKTTYSEEIVFCISYPTNWSRLDVAIYELIIKSSVLGSGYYVGKHTSIVFESELNAVALYMKDIGAFDETENVYSLLIIDADDSNLNLKVVSPSMNGACEVKCEHLGMNIVDYIIRDWYLDEMKKNPASWAIYEGLLKDNPTIPNTLASSCRCARENLCSTTTGTAVVHFGTFPSIKLTQDTLNNILNNTPISKVLKASFNLTDDEVKATEDKNWYDLLEESLIQKKKELLSRGVKIGAIHIPSKIYELMPPQMFCSVFDCTKMGIELDNSRMVSKGLALTGAFVDLVRKK